MPQAAMAIAAVIGAGASVVGGVKQEQARQQADNEMGRQATKRQQIEDEAKAKLADEAAKSESEATRNSQAAAVRAKAKTGRSSTILTSPLGLQGQSGKTLLGS